MTCTRCNSAVTTRFGTYGKRRVQRFRCASCKKTFALPQPKVGNHYIEPAKVAQILAMMLEGCSIRSISRLTDTDKGTILRLLETAGRRCEMIWDSYMRNIRTRFVQADEMWSYVGCHQKRLPSDAPATWGDQWLWYGIDSESKLIVSFHIGRRDGTSADAFIKDLSQRIEGRFQLTTDSLRWYSPVVDEYLGAQCDYGMLLKMFGSRDLSGPEWYGTTNQVIRTVPKVMNGRPDPRRISTSHIERANLTVRQTLKRFARMTLAYSKSLENMKHAVTLYMCWYNLCRVNTSVRMSPCMAHGLTNRLWSLEELLGAA